MRSLTQKRQELSNAMIINRRMLTAAILSTLCALSMSASARADALGYHRGAVLADAPRLELTASGITTGGAVIRAPARPAATPSGRR